MTESQPETEKSSMEKTMDKHALSTNPCRQKLTLFEIAKIIPNSDIKIVKMDLKQLFEATFKLNDLLSAGLSPENICKLALLKTEVPGIILCFNEIKNLMLSEEECKQLETTLSKIRNWAFLPNNIYHWVLGKDVLKAILLDSDLLVKLGVRKEDSIHPEKINLQITGLLAPSRKFREDIVNDGFNPQLSILNCPYRSKCATLSVHYGFQRFSCENCSLLKGKTAIKNEVPRIYIIDSDNIRPAQPESTAEIIIPSNDEVEKVTESVVSTTPNVSEIHSKPKTRKVSATPEERIIELQYTVDQLFKATITPHDIIAANISPQSLCKFFLLKEANPQLTMRLEEINGLLLEEDDYKALDVTKKDFIKHCRIPDAIYRQIKAKKTINSIVFTDEYLVLTGIEKEDLATMDTTTVRITGIRKNDLKLFTKIKHELLKTEHSAHNCPYRSKCSLAADKEKLVAFTCKCCPLYEKYKNRVKKFDSATISSAGSLGYARMGSAPATQNVAKK